MVLRSDTVVAIMSETTSTDFEIVEAGNVEAATRVFRRDGFVLLANALTDRQLQLAQQGADRIVEEQTAAIALDKANRGFARYSFGQQIQHPEWAQLVDLPPVSDIVTTIWGSDDVTCSGGGGDYSLPGAKIQHLHSDIADCLNDPEGRTVLADLPTPFIVVNFPMVDFRRENGATRFIPCTQRHRQRPPGLDKEPEWMRQQIVRAPAGSALIRDVRTWHGGTANTSNETRVMTSVGYYAPWFRRPGSAEAVMPYDVYESLTERGQRWCRSLALGAQAGDAH
jgi:hypothetical protein